MDNNTWLPKCLAHIDESYIKQTDDFVVIGELSSKSHNGFAGKRELYTAFVPLDRVQAVLNHPGGIGHEVEAGGPFPSVKQGDTFKSDFWIRGTTGDERFEPLVVGWEYHNKTVMMPDNGLLMCYGLCPRIVKSSDEIIWDNLVLPQYDVLYVKPLSHYEFPTCSGCMVKINKQYLEDYASLKNSAVVAVFYEERYCEIDNELEALLNGRSDISLTVPGRLIDIKHSDYHGNETVLCQIWGCRLVLIPEGKPISEEQSFDLEWPDYPGIMTRDRARKQSISSLVYVNDQVLEQFEGRSEYQINPKSGSVSYDGRWALSYGQRVGRDYIAYEIKKIYEGCPSSIIRHIHRHAVPKNIAVNQKGTYGNTNIGHRAAKLIEAFGTLGMELANICDSFDLTADDFDITGFSKTDVEYQGWWTLANLKPLGYRVALDITQEQFLDRCKDVYQLFEGLKERALRKLLQKMGMKDEQMKGLKSFRLFAMLMQLCSIALESGLDLVQQHEEIVERWKPEIRLEELRFLFALADLRNAAAHISSEEKVQAALEVYGIDAGSMTIGWGIAVDQVYDKLTESLVKLIQILQRCQEDWAE